MLSRLIPLILFFAVTYVDAQPQGGVPDSVVEAIAKDLAKMQRSVEEARRKQEAAMFAQTIKWPGATSITVTAASAPIRAGASDAARSITNAKQGTKYRVIDKVDDWYAVVFDRPIGGLTSGWVKAANAVPVPGSLAIVSSSYSAAAEDIYKQLVEQASRMRQAYLNNPYVSVSGFDVGLPLTLTVSFQFKDTPTRK